MEFYCDIRVGTSYHNPHPLLHFIPRQQQLLVLLWVVQLS